MTSPFAQLAFRRGAVGFDRRDENARARPQGRKSGRSAARVGAFCPATPMYDRRIRPSRINRPTTNCAVFAAIAKHRPCAPEMTAVLTPMTSPRELTSGPPEFPGIERRVGLNDVVHQPARPRSQRSTERADDARRDRGREPERVADGDHELANFNRLRIAEPQRCESRRRCSDDGEVGVRIFADELGRQPAPVGERRREWLFAL